MILDRETPPKKKNKAEFHRGGKAFLKLGFTAHCTQKKGRIFKHLILKEDPVKKDVDEHKERLGSMKGIRRPQNGVDGGLRVDEQPGETHASSRPTVFEAHTKGKRT